MPNHNKKSKEKLKKAPGRNMETPPKEPMFDEQYYKDREEEKRMEKLRKEDEAAWYYHTERKRLKDHLFYEIKKYIDDAPDISLVEKKEILTLVKKYTVSQLTSLKDKIIKEGIKEGLAQLKAQKKFIKGKKASD